MELILCLAHSAQISQGATPPPSTVLLASNRPNLTHYHHWQNYKQGHKHELQAATSYEHYDVTRAIMTL